MSFFDILVLFIGAFVGRPWLAFVVGGIFIAVGYVLLRKDELGGGLFVNLTGVTWILFGLWELYLISTGWSGFMFRIDILPIAFVLQIMSLVSFFNVRSGW